MFYWYRTLRTAWGGAADDMKLVRDTRGEVARYWCARFSAWAAGLFFVFECRAIAAELDRLWLAEWRTEPIGE